MTVVSLYAIPTVEVTTQQEFVKKVREAIQKGKDVLVVWETDATGTFQYEWERCNGLCWSGNDVDGIFDFGPVAKGSTIHKAIYGGLTLK